MCRELGRRLIFRTGRALTLVTAALTSDEDDSRGSYERAL